MKNNLRLFYAASAVAVTSVTPDVVRAAEDAAQSSSGMPQLDPATFIGQIVWLVIAFVVLFYFLNKKLLPSIIAARDARQARIDEDLEQAAKLRADAETALAEYEKVVADARDRAGETIKSAMDTLQGEFAERQAAFDAEIGAKLSAAEARIRQARDAALVEVNGVAVEVASAATTKLLGSTIDHRDVEQAVTAVQQEVA